MYKIRLDDKMNYIFKPFEGINEIRFGMSQEEVEILEGETDDIKENPIFREIIEIRNGISYIYRSKRLIEIKFGEKFDFDKNSIIWSNIKIYNDIETINILSDMPETKHSEIVKGVIVFHGIGICFSGFKKMKLIIEKELTFYSIERIRFFEIRVDKNKL
jgi:hypothetical protein